MLCMCFGSLELLGFFAFVASTGGLTHAVTIIRNRASNKLTCDLNNSTTVSEKEVE